MGSSGENTSTKSSSVDSIAGKPPLPPGVANSNGTNGHGTGNASSNGGTIQPKTASIRARPSSGRITASEIEELFSEKSINGAAEIDGKPVWTSPSSTLTASGHKIYASVAEMKRSKVIIIIFCIILLV